MGLAEFYLGYKSYHMNVVNKWIHIFGVPLLSLSLLSYLRLLPIGSDQPTDLLQLHWGLLLLVLQVGFYARLEVFATVVFAVGYSGLYVLGNYMYLVLGPSHLFVCTAIQVIGWGSQFFGHGYFEGNKPALMDNVLMSLMAPLFTTIEVMALFGYVPEVEKAKKP
jgi:uncharacterized membrane protein YGL010W